MPITSQQRTCSDMEAPQGELGCDGGIGGNIGQGRLRKEAWMDI